ncbi:hypothetical protein AB3X52_00385 [Nocardioides sp. DS6]|uniref:Uncharacterized protein n=1 Tax=Nocardioides eburneus TaxID=3231482 RepID=A0ABV3ST88_9ACTN
MERVLCESCARDREIREENVSAIKQVLSVSGMPLTTEHEVAFGPVREARHRPGQLAHQIGAPFATIPIPSAGGPAE